MNKIDISTDIQEFSDIEISDYSDATASENSFENILATNVFEPNLSTIRERVLNKNNNDDDDKIEIETEEAEKLEEFGEEMPKSKIDIEEEKKLSNRNEEKGQTTETQNQNQNLEEGIDDNNDKDEDIKQDETEVQENKEQDKSAKKLLVKKNSLKRATREKTDHKLGSEPSSKAQMDVLKPNRVIIPPKIPEEPEDEYQLQKQFARAVEAFDYVQENHVLAPKNSVIEINGPDASEQVDLRQKKPILLSQVQKFSRSDLEKRVSNVTLTSKPSNEIPEVVEDNAITNTNISPEPIINNAMDNFVSVFNNQNKHVSLINQPSNATSEFGIKESLEKIVNDVNQKSKKQPDLRQLSFFTVASFQNEPVPPGNYSKSLNINTVDPNKIGIDMRRDTISGMMSYQPTDQESSMRVQPNHIYQSIRNENENNNDNIYEHPELTKAQTVLSVGTPFESHNLVQIQKSKNNPNLRKGLASTPDISMSFRELPSVPNDSSYNENPTMPSKVLSSMSTQFQGTPHSEAGLQILKEIENTLKRKKSDNDAIEDDGNRSGEFRIEGEENNNSDSDSDQTFAPKVQKAPKSKKFRLTRKTSKAQSLKSLKKHSKDNTKDRKTDIINEAQRKYATNKNIDQPRPNTPQINPALAKQIAQLNQKQKYSHFLTLPLRFLVSLLNGALFSVGLVLFIIGIWGSIDAKFDGVVDDIYIYSDPTFASLIFGGLWFWWGQKEVYFFCTEKTFISS